MELYRVGWTPRAPTSEPGAGWRGIGPAMSGLWAYGAVLAAEHPERRPLLVDPAGAPADRVRALVASGETGAWAWRGGWHRRTLMPLEPAAARISGTWWVVGTGLAAAAASRAVETCGGVAVLVDPNERPAGEPAGGVFVAPVPPSKPLRLGTYARAPRLDLIAGPVPWLLVGDAALVTGRPGGGAAAVHAAQLGALARRRPDTGLLLLGDVAEGGGRRLGIAPLSGAAVEEAVAASLLQRDTRVALDVDWATAVRAFPHIAPIGAHLVPGGEGDVAGVVRAAVRRILGLDQDPPNDRALAELGLDSLGAVELRDRISAALGRPLPVSFAFDHPTVRRMIASLSTSSEAAADELDALLRE